MFKSITVNLDKKRGRIDWLIEELHWLVDLEKRALEGYAEFIKTHRTIRADYYNFIFHDLHDQIFHQRIYVEQEIETEQIAAMGVHQIWLIP
jgi:hypothetical protein